MAMQCWYIKVLQNNIILCNFFKTEMQRIHGCPAVGWYCNVLGVSIFIYTAQTLRKRMCI